MANWRTVNARQILENRKETYEERFMALAFLMASADLFDFRQLDAEDEVVRARWARLQTLAGNR
jgi:uncharacterized membrane protein